MKNFLITHKNTYRFLYLNNTSPTINNIPKSNFLVHLVSKSELSGLIYNTIKGTRLFCTTIPKLSPTRDERNAKLHNERLIKSDRDLEARLEIYEKNKKRNSDDNYRVYDDYLSGEDSVENKLSHIDDHVATTKANYATKLIDCELKGLSDNHPDVKSAIKEYKDDLGALTQALKDNKLEKNIDPSLGVGVSETNSAIELKNEELRQRNLELRYNNPEQYNKEVDEYLENQKQSEPFDLSDPDG